MSSSSRALEEHGSSCQCSEAVTRLSSRPLKVFKLEGHEQLQCNVLSSTLCDDGMVLINGSNFLMGTSRPVFEQDGEGPARLVTLGSFFLDIHEVSNGQFEAFVTQTNYVTEAEKFDSSFVLGSLIKNSSLKQSIKESVKSAPWWLPVQGANWRKPEGEGSSLDGRRDHPVVHVSWNDAVAYCKWAGKDLPTEAQWEMACKAGLRDRLYSWGNKWNPKGQFMANTWQGPFPHIDEGTDGYVGTAPVDSFPANKYGLKNMIGNVWEWTADWWAADHGTGAAIDPKGPAEGTDKVKKGGSFMCHEKFCFDIDVTQGPITPLILRLPIWASGALGTT
ncbi:Formylglycine-generating enzyme [Halotydeus destructor]|nr:Formylglycine-generating enzyme [Halotydeus destructor]